MIRWFFKLRLLQLAVSVPKVKIRIKPYCLSITPLPILQCQHVKNRFELCYRLLFQIQFTFSKKTGPIPLFLYENISLWSEPLLMLIIRFVSLWFVWIPLIVRDTAQYDFTPTCVSVWKDCFKCRIKKDSFSRTRVNI